MSTTPEFLRTGYLRVHVFNIVYTLYIYTQLSMYGIGNWEYGRLGCPTTRKSCCEVQKQKVCAWPVLESKKNTEKVSLLLFVLGITHSSLSAGSSLKYLQDFQISSFGGSHGPGSTTSEPFSLNKKLQSLTNTCTFASKQFFGGWTP